MRLSSSSSNRQNSGALKRARNGRQRNPAITFFSLVAMPLLLLLYVSQIQQSNCSGLCVASSAGPDGDCMRPACRVSLAGQPTDCSPHNQTATTRGQVETADRYSSHSVTSRLRTAGQRGRETSHGPTGCLPNQTARYVIEARCHETSRWQS